VVGVSKLTDRLRKFCCILSWEIERMEELPNGRLNQDE
jgi:hypothetical protein